MPPPLKYLGCGATTAGKIRPSNEDRFFADNTAGWFAVADGVGGLPYGERASDCVIRTLQRSIAGPEGALPSEELVARCHAAVRQLGHLLDSRIGIGTTLTLVRLSGRVAELAHVGDGVAFLHRDRGETLRKLTREHSVPVPPVWLRGAAAPFIAPPRLDRYLGQSPPLHCDVIPVDLEPGDRLLLCSDGITRAFDERELAAMSLAQPDPVALARALTHVADLRGGLDNATTVVVDISTPRRNMISA